MIELIQTIWLIFGSIIGLILLIVIGYTILNLLPENNYFTPIQRFVLSYGLGTGSISLSMLVFILLGVHSRLSFIPMLMIIIFLFFKFRVFKKLRTDIKKIFNLMKNIIFNWIEIVCIIFLVIELIFIFFFWLLYPVYSWDALCMWDAKAKYIFFEGNLNYLSWDIPHPDYPLLVSLNLTFFYSIFFQYHYYSKIFFVFVFISLILIIYSTLRYFKLNKTYSILISTFLISVSDIFYHATIAYADLTLTFFYTLSVILLFYYFKTKKVIFIIYSAIFMGFMAWTKNEGLGLLFVNFGVIMIYNTVLFFKNNINIKKYLASTAIIPTVVFIIYLPWFLTCRAYNFTNNYTSNIEQLLDIERSINDLKIIFRYIIQMPFLFSLFWIVFLLLLILNFRFIMKEENFFLILLILFHFFLYIGIYIITPYNLEWHLRTSYNREVLHMIPICCFLIGIILANREDNRIYIDNKKDYLIIGSSIAVSILVFIFFSIILV